MKDKEKIARELLVSARRLLEEVRIISAIFLVKDALNVMGWREKARVLERSNTTGS